MAKVDLIMPKMGESILEATILKWIKQVGDTVELDETILEIATDKVDSEVPSPVEGTLTEIRFKEDDVVPIGTVIAVIETAADSSAPQASPATAAPTSQPEQPTPAATTTTPPAAPLAAPTPTTATVPTKSQPGKVARVGTGGRFYSPLVRNIAQQEGISTAELDELPGSGRNGRVTKKDVLSYLDDRDSQPIAPASAPNMPAGTPSADGLTEIIEMDRMRKIIAKHMVESKKTSPHVTSFIEVDVTNIVNWRNANKAKFQERYGEKITYTPIFVEAVVQALKDFPMVNISVDGDKLIRKKQLNIGMATALPSGNLIVPVIQQADQYSLSGLARQVNDLANRARNNQLKPEDIQGGTFTLTNVGTFGNVMGTPIINQPQVAIMAIGAIRKKPAVVETEYGDLIAVRQLMFLSLSYDHRVVDGFLGGSFLRRVGDYMEAFDPKRQI